MPFDWQAELTAPTSLPLIPAWNSHASTSVTTEQLITAPPKSFDAVVGGFRSSPVEEAPYPVPCIKGDSLSIRIGQDDYVKGLAKCQFALQGRLTLSKGDKPYTARDLASKLGKVWKMVPLGRGCYNFLFEHPDDLSHIWIAGTVSLQPGLLRLSQWTKDFNHNSQTQTHASLWIRLVELPHEYWRERTLKVIASVVGTPISIDGPARNRAFGHYARILVDIDLSMRVYEEILVEREGFAFKVEVQYERRPLFCHHCYVIGHNVTNCKWLNPEAAKVTDRGKKQVPKTNNSNQPSVVKGSSSSGTLRYVPVVPPPTAATTDATVTQAAVPPPTAATSDGTATQAIVPPSVATTNENAIEFDVPVAIASTTNENATQSVPQRDVATSCFRYILQDVSNADPQGNLPRPDVPWQQP